MNPFILYPTIYAVGWLITWIFGARHWLNEFGTHRSGEFAAAGAWGFILGMGWPLVTLGYGIAKLASIGLR